MRDRYSAPKQPGDLGVRHLSTGRAVAPDGTIFSLLGALMERTTPFSAPVLVNVETRTMLCPRCEREQPMREFVMLGMSPFYASQLVPIYRCGSCSHPFALRPSMLGEV